MSLPATAVFEVRTTGSDLACGGGFNSARGGTDYSQQDTAQATGTVTSATTTVTATTGIFTSVMVGNLITDGTTYKEITAFTSATVVTVDSAPSWTATTVYVGGALNSPGKASAVRVSGNKTYIKTGAYSVTSASSNVAGGLISSVGKDGTNSAMTYTEGYAVTRGDLGAPPVIQMQALLGSSLTLWDFANHTGERVVNIALDCNGNTTSTGFGRAGQGCSMELCKVSGATSGFTATNTSASSVINRCEASGCTTGFGVTGNCDVAIYWSIAHGCTTGFSLTGNGNNTQGCIAYGNSGAGFVSSGSYGRQFVNCSSYGNGTYGYDFGSDAVGIAGINCISYGNTSAEFRTSGTVNGLELINCAGVSGAYNASQVGRVIGFITLTANPFSNAASGNFALNNVAGGGVLCRAAGIPGAFPGGLTTGYLDIGAAQHQDAGGGISRSRSV